MYLHKFILTGVAASAIALTGCSHETHAANNPPDAAMTPNSTEQTAQPCSYNPASTTQANVYGASSGQFAAQGYIGSMDRPVMIIDQPPVPAAAIPEPAVQSEPAYSTYYERDRRGHLHKRSRRRSAAIVVGGAAAGAGIGAIAGGGRGAAIGAASGGTAGFIYDRMTHNQH